MELAELIKRCFTGGPRQRGKAWQELDSLVAKGLDVAAHLPALDAAGDQRRSVEQTRIACDVLAGRVEAILELLAVSVMPSVIFSRAGHLVARRPDLVAPLLPAMIGYSRGDDDERALFAAQAVGEWLERGAALSPAQQVVLVEGLSDERKVGGRAVGRQLAWALGFVPTAWPALRARLHSGSETARENAAFALARSGFDLAVLLEDDDLAVSSEAARFVGDNPKIAAQLLSDPTRMSADAKWSMAKGIAARMAPRQPPAEVLLLVAELESDEVGKRRQIGQIGGLAIEHVDCLWAAPFLALALADVDAGVRTEAASSLYYLFDEMPHPIVHITQPALQSALARETDAGAREQLRIALAAAARARQP